MPSNELLLEQLAERGWAVVPNWISSETVSALQSLFTDLTFTAARVGKDENLAERSEIRGDSTCWINHLLPPFKLLATIDRLEELRVDCNRQLFLGLRDWEIHLAKYPVSAFYRLHRDRHEKSSRRVLSVVLYLNEAWEESDGGELVLYDSRGDLVTKIFPRGGTLVCFLSADFPHEVKPALRERRSLTGWFLSGGSDVPAL